MIETAGGKNECHRRFQQTERIKRFFCGACWLWHRGVAGQYRYDPPPLIPCFPDAEAFINAADHFFKDFASAVGTPPS
jgi:hypothetical protein